MMSMLICRQFFFETTRKAFRQPVVLYDVALACCDKLTEADGVVVQAWLTLGQLWYL